MTTSIPPVVTSRRFASRGTTAANGRHTLTRANCPSGATACYSSALLGIVAYRTGKKIEWDSRHLKASNCPEADQFVEREYRKGWTL